MTGAANACSSVGVTEVSKPGADADDLLATLRGAYALRRIRRRRDPRNSACSGSMAVALPRRLPVSGRFRGCCAMGELVERVDVDLEEDGGAGGSLDCEP